MNISEISFSGFKEISKEKEGIVVLGAGGDLNEWINGVSETLFEEQISLSKDPSDMFEQTLYHLISTGGRNDLAFIFSKDSKLDIGKMAMWRLRFGSCSWISDYVVNYSSHF